MALKIQEVCEISENNRVNLRDFGTCFGEFMKIIK